MAGSAELAKRSPRCPERVEFLDGEPVAARFRNTFAILVEKEFVEVVIHVLIVFGFCCGVLHSGAKISRNYASLLKREGRGAIDQA